MEILQEDNGVKGRFYIMLDDECVAEMTYKWHDSHVDIDHTEVNDKLKGQHAGTKLVRAGVAWARERHLKLSASCPFANAVLRKEEYKDVFFA